MLKLSLLCKATSHAILIKWVAGTLICPVLSFLSAPATLKYLNIKHAIVPSVPEKFSKEPSAPFQAGGLDGS